MKINFNFVDSVEFEVVSYTRLYTVHLTALVAAVPGCQCAGFKCKICRILYQLLVSRAAVQNCQLIFVLILSYVGGLIDLMFPL